MKNNIIKVLGILFLLSYFFNSLIFAQEVLFEAENIKNIDENTIEANDNVVITDELGNKIYADKLILNKEKKIFKLTNNVVYKNNKYSIQIKTNEIYYNQQIKTISSIGNTFIQQDNKYNLEGKNIFFDIKNNKISSEDNALIKDTFGNVIEFKNFNLSINDELLITENAELIDLESNIYTIKKLYFDYGNNEILGKDVTINKDNKLSKKDYLPRIKSNSLVLQEGNTLLKKTVYTNCKKRDGCPPWIIEAEEINHDKKNKIVNYKNALLKFYDIPVLYFPKFFHPDPTVKRQSGFLTPIFKTQNTSSYFKVPYYFAISDNTDFTFSPRFYENQKNIYQGEYRNEQKNSSHVIDASIQNDSPLLTKNKTSKSHFFLNSSFKSSFDFFDESEINLKLQTVSNENYLKTNNIKSPIITSQNTLNSLLSFEGSNDDSNFSLSAEIFEDLNKEKTSDKYEYIFPSLDFSKDFKTNLGGQLNMTNMAYNKQYQTNINEKILVNNLTYKSLDIINSFGLLNNYEILLKNFNADSKNSPTLKNKNENNLQGMFQFNSKLPLQKNGKKFDSTLTPIFVAKINPSSNKNIRNNDRIVDYNNIYSPNRVSSNETLEGGESITIGNEFKIFNKENLDEEIFGINLASSFRNKKNLDLPKNSSIGEKTSNIVGQMNLKTNEFLEFGYDFLADNNLGKFNYHKIESTFRVNNFVSTFEFVEENNDIGRENFVSNETSFAINDNKSLKFKTRRNKKTNLTEYYNLIYQYKMDCLVAGIEYNKNYYDSGGLKPEESIFFSITFMPFENKVNLPGLDK